MFTGLAGLGGPLPSDLKSAAASAKASGYSVPYSGYLSSSAPGGGYLSFANPNGQSADVAVGVVLLTDSTAPQVLTVISHQGFVMPPAIVIQWAIGQFFNNSASAASGGSASLPPAGALPNSGDSQTAIAMAKRDGVSIPYGTENAGGSTVLMVANPAGSLTNIPLRSTTPPYIDSGISVLGVNLSTSYIAQALSVYGMAGGSPNPLPAPPSPVSAPAPSSPVNPSAPSPQNPTVPTPAPSPAPVTPSTPPVSCWGLFGSSEPCFAGFPVGLYTAGLGAVAIGFFMFRGRRR